MANYVSAQRTNYFKVTDEEKYAELMSRVRGDEDILHLWTEEKDGRIFHAFGCESSMSYYPENEDGTEAEDEAPVEWEEFCRELSKLLPAGEAVIILEVGKEKLRYLTGYAEIITKHGTEFVDLTRTAIEKARKCLGNDTWSTRIEY